MTGWDTAPGRIGRRRAKQNFATPLARRRRSRVDAGGRCDAQRNNPGFHLIVLQIREVPNGQFACVFYAHLQKVEKSRFPVR
jgi:hypothetical protein